MDSGTYFSPYKNPRENANLLSILFFCWTCSIFRKGFKKELDEEDLYKPLKNHSSRILGDKLEQSWKKERELHKNPSLWRALSRVFLVEFLMFGFALFFIEFGLKLSQPWAIGKLLMYFSLNESKITKTEAYIYAFMLIGFTFLYVIAAHTYMFCIQHLGMKIRIACSSLIYRKALRLSRSALSQTTIGQMVNLLSNDVSRFDTATINVHNIWVTPLETLVFPYIIYLQVGLTGVVGIGFLLMFIPLQMYFGKKSSIYRLKTAIRTDERIRLMSEIIAGIQVIKMYTWEKSFGKLVADARRSEIKHIQSVSFVQALLFSITIFSPRFAVFLCVLTYVLMGNRLNAGYVFIVSAFYNILRQSMTIQFPRGVSQFAEATVSIRRIRNFLMYEELVKENETNMANTSQDDTGNDSYQKQSKNIALDSSTLIYIKEGSAVYTSENVLSNITMQIHQNQLVALVGRVGCGKTSLLNVFLRELPLTSGKLVVNGNISYAAQEPWIFAGTVKQNILFGEPMKTERYQTVIRVCALGKDISLLHFGDNTIVGEKGVTLSGGQKARINLARAVYKEADIYLLDDPLSAVDTRVGKQLFDECVTGFLKNKCTILVTHQLQYLTNVSRIYLLEHGRIQAEGTYQELQTLSIDFAKELGKQADLKENLDIIDEPRPPIQSKENDTSTAYKEHKATGEVAVDVYRSYLKAGGNWYTVFFIFFLFVLTQASGSSADYFIAYWVNNEQTQTENTTATHSLSREIYIYTYSGISVTTIVLALVRSFLFFLFCMRASTRLHDRMFKNIVHATMRFFTLNSSGRILNRFSMDIGVIDDLLPTIMFDCLQIGLTATAVIVVISVVNQWMLIPAGVILLIFYLLRKAYLRTSRNVKRLEGMTRSPVFAHITASLQGLTTIRAFQVQHVREQEFDNYQDKHSSAYYLHLACSRAFGFWLDLISCCYIGVVTLNFLIIREETFGGNVGLAITQSMSLTGMFQWGIRQWSELENQMTSVERVVEYTRIENEPDRTEIKPRKSWPLNGNVEFQSVSLRYSLHDPYVLKSLSFHVNAKEKVGIVGRTGAGKSSLINVLFQLTEIEGAILIDNVNIRLIPLHDLRSKISVIPQEPVLFSGTLRKNLDPFDQYTDYVLWTALKEVELEDIVEDSHEDLQLKVSEGGSNFSVGQRQLLCLARALIRNNKILVLDEATANVDPRTDSLIQKTIRRKFADCTVLTIAHRLNTVMDSDKVLVMDSGSVVEFDRPYILLQNKDSVFYGMVQQTGQAMMQKLISLAEESYKKS